MAKQKMNAAQRIESIVERAKMRGAAVTKIGDCQVECFLSASYFANGLSKTQKLCFRIEGKRVSRFDLLAWAELALS
jgi:hypothetical protein